MKDRCIIIIDPQKDFTSTEGAYAKRHPQLTAITQAVQRIQALINAPYPADLIVVYSNYTANQFGDNLDMCIPGTDGHEPGICIPADAFILSKSQHSAFTDPVFSSFIQEQQYKHLYLAGLLAEYCVRKTALDGLQQGYAITLLQDCIATGDDSLWKLKEVFDELTQAGASITRSTEH
jgi:nicotinamidase/pyrazinamidase